MQQPTPQSSAPARTVAPIPDQPYLRATQAAARYGIGRSTFWLYVKEGKLPPPICFGPRIRFWKVEELDHAFEHGLDRAST